MHAATLYVRPEKNRWRTASGGSKVVVPDHRTLIAVRLRNCCVVCMFVIIMLPIHHHHRPSDHSKSVCVLPMMRHLREHAIYD